MISSVHRPVPTSPSQVPLTAEGAGSARQTPDSRDEVPFSPDFVSAVSIISNVYSQGRYLNFDEIDGNPKERALSVLGKGSVFVAYKREIELKLPSQTQLGQYETRRTSVVFKKPKSLFSVSGKPTLPAEVQAFLMETQILCHRPLYWHPNIITVLGISWKLDLYSMTPAAQPQLVLEAADQALDKLLQTSPNIPFQTRMRLSLDITNGLSALHACDIIHGDLKPANILLCSSLAGPNHIFRAKIADFSHSYIINQVPSRRVVGSPGYRAPEIVRREIITDFRPADVYSLGCTLWRLLVKDTEIPVHFLHSHNEETSATNDPFIFTVLAELRRHLERDANYNRRSFLERIFRASLCMRPDSRQLHGIQQAILLYLRTGPDPLDEEELASIMGLAHAMQPRALQEIPPCEVFINYQLFQRAPGPVQDQMVEALQAMGQDPSDTRFPRALYELGICNLAKLGDPHKSSIEAGLLLIHQAAEYGVIAAKGYINRVANTFAEGVHGQRATLPELRVPTAWLVDAAAAGHEVAYEEFTLGGRHKGNKELILQLRATTRFKSALAIDNLSLFERVIRKIPQPQLAESLVINKTGDTILHWAAYRNLEQHLRFLLGGDEQALGVDVRNCYGDTALITACSAGNLEAALFLIYAGANVNLTNLRNETCLHHLWRFTDEEGLVLLDKLLERQINPEIEAEGSFLYEIGSVHSSHEQTSTELDPLPVLPGTAIQRLVGRGRTALLHNFLLVAPPTSPRDGNLVRQMIRWASALSFPDTRKVLIAYARGHERTTPLPVLDRELGHASIEHTTFELEGVESGYLDALARGWLSTRRGCWNSPDIWWRICCHGQKWWERLETSMDAMIWNSSKALCCYHSTLLFALQNHSLAFFRNFLQKRIDIRIERRLRRRSQLDCACKRNHALTSLPRGKMKLGAPIRPIDRIFYKDGRTLLHLTIIMGSRAAFVALAGEFNADVEQLVNCQSPNEYPPHSHNAYALIARYSKDAWFMHELLAAGLHPKYAGPLQSLPVFNWRWFDPFYEWAISYYFYIPPLLHAFDYGCHFLVRFLLDHGVDIQEPISPYSTTFDYILSPAIINQGTIQFLFARKGLYQTGSRGLKAISPALLPESLFNERNGLGVFQLIHHQQQLSPNEPIPLLRQFSRIRTWRYPFEMFMVCILRMCWHAVYSVYALPLNYLALPGLYTLEIEERPLRKERESISRKRNEKKGMHYKPLGLHVTSSTEAEEDKVFFNHIWNELLRMFPNTHVSSYWRREGYGFHLSHSLLRMALLGNRTLGEWPICPGPWCLSSVAICHYTLWPNEAVKKWSQADSMVATTLKLYEKTVLYHKPSLVNILICDDYDFVPSDSMIAKSLYNMGHRHSLLYFHEVRIAITFLLSTTPLIAFVLMRFKLVSFTMAGVITFYPSVFLSVFERPYFMLLPFRILLIVGWPLLTRPIYLRPTLLLFFQFLMLLLISPFSLLGFIEMRRQGQFRSRERFLFNALRPGSRYAGYSPKRLFISPSREGAFQLQG